MTPPLLRDDDTVDDATTVLVEGRTAEEALEKVHRDLGDDARILQAEKVRRGGVGGFFAREMVQLTVVADEGPDAVEPGLAEPLFAGSEAEQPMPALVGAAPPDPITRMTAAADADEMAFGTALRTALAVPPAPPASHLAPERSTTPVPPAAPVAPGAPVADEVGEVDEPAVIAAPVVRPGAAGPATARRAHWATAAGRAGMRSLAQGAEALATTRIEATDVDVVARPAATIDLDALEATGTGRPSALATAAATAPPAPPAGSAPRATTPTPAPPAPVATAATRPAPSAPAPAAPTPGTPRWSRDRLLRLGLSDTLVDEVEAAAPADDLAWMHALARVVEPLLRPAPAGDCVYVGGRVERHAKGAGATVCRPSDPGAPVGPLAIARRPGDGVRTWLAAHAPDHWLHLVVGGEGWREWLWEQPVAVSWAAPEDLPLALGVARSFGLPLVGTVGVDGPVSAAAVDIAMAIRAMLERP